MREEGVREQVVIVRRQHQRPPQPGQRLGLLRDGGLTGGPWMSAPCRASLNASGVPAFSARTARLARRTRSSREGHFSSSFCAWLNPAAFSNSSIIPFQSVHVARLIPEPMNGTSRPDS
jgi:hypothetical protein